MRTMLVTTLLLAPAALAQPTFTPLGFLNDDGFGPSIAFGVSADGSTVVGEAVSPQGFEAFRWRADEGMIGLGDIPGGFFSSVAYACTPDGNIIVGASEDATSGEEGTPFIWTESTGMLPLGTLGGPTSYGQAQAISCDGDVIVGASQGPSGGVFAFRWTPETGMVSLGDFPGGQALSRASGVSCDGRTIAGTGSTSSFFNQAFIWKQNTGLVPIAGNDAALAISADGTTVVGTISGVAFRWTEADGIHSLGKINGGNGLYLAQAVSADGSVIVGLANYGGKQGTGEAFIWDAAHGIRDLNVVLTQDYGLNLQGLFLFDARGISNDGKVIAGYGFNQQGEQEAWVVNLRNKPTTAALRDR